MPEKNDQLQPDTAEDMHEKRIRMRTLIAGAIIILLFAVGTLEFFVWSKNPDRLWLASLSRVIPFPAAWIGGKKLITFHSLKRTLDSVRQFYTAQDFSEVGMRVDFETEEGKKRLKLREKYIFEHLIESEMIELLAHQRGITVTNDMVDASVDRKLQEFGSREQVIERLKKLYGWDLDDFKREVVKPALYQEALAKYVAENETDNSGAREKIEKAAEALKAKEDFAKVAQRFSEGKSASQDGNLGWIYEFQLIPEVALEVQKLQKGETSGIIESNLGYHIIKLLDRETREEREMVNIQQIFVRTSDFGEWITQQKTIFSVRLFLKDYSWNAGAGHLEFTSDIMKDFEASQEGQFQQEMSELINS